MDKGTEGRTRLRAEYFASLQRRRWTGALAVLIFAAMMIAGFMAADAENSGSFWGGVLHIFDFPGEILSEAARKASAIPALLVHYFPALVETLNIAAIATLVGTLGGAVASVLATPGLAPWPRAIPVFRRLMDISRAFPEIVVALVLIYVLGGGPVPATIAISIHAVGALGKLFSEVNENADLKPVEGLTSVGAGWLQRIWLGVVPQVAPNYLSYALLRFEINIRASAILGFVGAGGIGYELRNAISWGKGRYDAAAAVFILLILTIVVVDQTSSGLRNRLTKGA